MPDQIPTDLPHGETLILDGRVYRRCGRCNRVVRVNRPLLGALHWCRRWRPGDEWTEEDAWEQMR